MYGLPPDLNLSVFHDKTLLQACFGVHDLILGFDGNLSITILSSIDLHTATQLSTNVEDYRTAATGILSLVNDKVINADSDDGRSLRLYFRTGQLLIIHDDSDVYESYIITLNNITTVV